MNIVPVSSHPSWCDPRAHVDHSVDAPEHRTAGLSWKPIAADTQLTVRTIRLDSTEDGTGLAYTGRVFVNLSIEDIESVYPCGRTIFAETDLDAADARMLAAALVCEAERVEALVARTVTW